VCGAKVARDESEMRSANSGADLEGLLDVEVQFECAKLDGGRCEREAAAGGAVGLAEHGADAGDLGQGGEGGDGDGGVS
jgi:hypothetical protein